MAGDLATSHYAEMGLRALEQGDIPGAVGAFASISDDGWELLKDRFSGFPMQITAIAGTPIALPGGSLAIENAADTWETDGEPDWARLGEHD